MQMIDVNSIDLPEMGQAMSNFKNWLCIFNLLNWVIALYFVFIQSDFNHDYLYYSFMEFFLFMESAIECLTHKFIFLVEQKWVNLPSERTKLRFCSRNKSFRIWLGFSCILKIQLIIFFGRYSKYVSLDQNII